jgi:hypothetical protein
MENLISGDVWPAKFETYIEMYGRSNVRHMLTLYKRSLRRLAPIASLDTR